MNTVFAVTEYFIHILVLGYITARCQLHWLHNVE
jgi:hypothetical protein